MSNKLSQAERLAAIEKRRALIEKKIKRKQRSMRHSYRELTAPVSSPGARLTYLMANAGTFATFAKGALVGYKVYKKVRKLF